MHLLTRWRVRHTRSVDSAKSGQSLVETALILPLLLVLLVGIIMFANAWRTSQTITNVTREGARVGVLQGVSADSVKERVKFLLANSGLDSTEASITVTPSTGLETAPTGTEVTVTTEYPAPLSPFDNVIGLLGGNSSESIMLSTTTTMRKE